MMLKHDVKMNSISLIKDMWKLSNIRLNYVSQNLMKHTYLYWYRLMFSINSYIEQSQLNIYNDTLNVIVFIHNSPLRFFTSIDWDS